jgi:hypothetical protein
MSGGMAERLELQPLSGHAVVRLPRRPAAPLPAAPLSAAQRRQPVGGRATRRRARSPRVDRIWAGPGSEPAAARQRGRMPPGRPSALTTYALVTGSSTLLPRSLSGTGTG